MDKNQKAKDKLTKERTKLLLRRPFFGTLALSLEFVPDPEVKTMSVDGENLYFNPDYVLRLAPRRTRTLIVHEVLHCALGHLWRQGEREDERWNYATDHAVNIILSKEGFDLPEGFLFDLQYDGMEAERIYALLKSGEQKPRQLGSHEKWSEKNSKSKQNKKQDGKPQKENEPQGKPDGKKMEKEWQERLSRTSASVRMHGKIPGSLDQMIKSVFEPKLDWRVILSDLVVSCTKNNFRLIPPSKKHLWRGMYLPSIEGRTIEIVLSGDSSYSISDDDFRTFIAEMRGIAEQFDYYIIHLFLSDAEVHFYETITSSDEWPEEFPKRNGGTCFGPVFRAIEEKNIDPMALIYLTDGDGDYPEYPPEYPVIWVLSKDREVPFGAAIVMDLGSAI